MVAMLVRAKLGLPSDRQADGVVKTVIDSIVEVIRQNINTDGFELKLPSFGKFVVRHKQGTRRRIPLTGRIQQTADKRKVKFLPLSEFRAMENWPDNERCS